MLAGVTLAMSLENAASMSGARYYLGHTHEVIIHPACARLASAAWAGSAGKLRPALVLERFTGSPGPHSGARLPLLSNIGRV
jgi:hypothetical protein